MICRKLFLIPEWFLALVSFTTCIFCAYAVVLFNVYDYHDSFLFFFETHIGNTVSCPLAPTFIFVDLTGRPLFPILYCYTVAPFMHGMEDAGWIRAQGLIIMSLAATMLYYYLLRCNLTSRAAFFGALFCFLLPGPQQFVYASHATVIVWAFLFVIAAGFCFLWFTEALDARSWISPAVLVLVTIGLLTLSTLIYQPVGETFLALVFVKTLAMRQQRVQKFLGISLWAIVIFALHVSVYAAVHYFIDVPLVLSQGVPATELFGHSRSISLSFKASTEVVSIMMDRTLRAFSLWFYGTRPYVACAIAVLTMGLYVIVVRAWLRNADAMRPDRRIYTIALPPLMLVAFAIATNGLVLVNPNSLLLLFRSMIAYQWVLVFMIAFLASELEQCIADSRSLAVGIGYVAIGLFIVAFVNWNLYFNFVKPNVAESLYIYRTLIAEQERLSGRICVVQADIETLAKDPSYLTIDEFSHTTTLFAQDIPVMISAIALSIGIRANIYGQIVRFHEIERPSNLKCDVTFDMRWLDHL